MNNLTELITTLCMPMVLVSCLALGYILKHWIKDVDNKLIPTILAVVGAVLACLVNEGISVEIITAGVISGLASTGLHQTFKNLIEKQNN